MVGLPLGELRLRSRVIGPRIWTPASILVDLSKGSKVSDYRECNRRVKSNEPVRLSGVAAQNLRLSLPRTDIYSDRMDGASAMRLSLAAAMVVAIFAFVLLLILRLFPYGAGWAGVCVAITCLYAGAFGAWALLVRRGYCSVPGGLSGQVKTGHMWSLQNRPCGPGLKACTPSFASRASLIVQDNSANSGFLLFNASFGSEGGAPAKLPAVGLSFVVEAHFLLEAQKKLF